ncbi:corticotropin-releasing factor receptor 1-like [Lytechinus variegatus]|uniref:corticotropin-releasing factor receptor 1-like n=2 Tax=Lytechinus variegatus TaxID=7654 RepID=UPI001BB22F09|nr:corticotropin-releasing factor receptor 1-like [Lytechinus variegatus]
MRDLNPPPSPASPSNETTLSSVSDYDFVHDLSNLLCEMEYLNKTKMFIDRGVSFCNASHDKLLCWPPIEAGDNVSIPCPPRTYPFKATRFCLDTGEWAAFTHYNDCHTFIFPEQPTSPTFYLALRYVYLIGITLSLVLLLITLFIFCYFKALQCTRIAIHKNLVVSFIFRYILMIIQLQPLLTMDYSTEFQLSSSSFQDDNKNDFVLHKVPGFCRLILVLLEYFSMANMYWMFVEGLYLTSRIAVAVFSTESNFKIYLAIGWVSPLLFTIPWAIVMGYHSSSPCWVDYLDTAYIWILRAPLIAALVINTLFLINIIRILITKLQASNTMETNQMRKATKAVAVLFPLLGLTNLIFFWHGNSENETEMKAFTVTNAVLQSTQGVFVAVIYCFLNTEVRKLVKRKVLASLDEYGKRTPRRSHQYHTTNGSCGVPTTSEVVMAVSYRRSTHDQSTIADPEQYTEMKPFTSECGES